MGKHDTSGRERRRSRPERALALPLTFTLLLAALALVPSVWNNPNLRWSFFGAGGVLFAWIAVSLVAARRRGRTLTVEVVLRKQHYLQACAHLSILLYWGWYWREVYHAAPQIAAQLVFAYAFDALLTWSRRDAYLFGFGPFPIVFSTNLFLFFKPDWFYLQFLMIGVGFAAKEMIRWHKEGRRTHIFNPSSFTLTLFSLILLATGATAISWGPEISNTQLNPPHIYLLIFLVSLPAQVLFGTATMTLSAVATAYLFGVAYFAAFGVHFWFPDSIALQEPLPIAVFLGMHLLFTDPSTSPRTELGRILFGVLYGLMVAALFSLLASLGLPSFYDKLLPVPILNLMILGIDGAARSRWLSRFDPGTLGRSLTPRQRNLGYVTVWIAAFGTMQVVSAPLTTLIRADGFLLQGRMDEAIAGYREFVANDSARAEGDQRLGTALMQAGRFEEAVPTLRHAIDLQPGNPNTYNSLGAALTQAGRPQEAVAFLQRAIELQPENAMAHSNLGLALIRTRRFQEATTSLRHVVELQPNSSEAHDRLGQALIGAGLLAEAVNSFRRAVELQPDSPDANGRLGLALMQAGRIDEAVPVLQRAADLQPHLPDAHHNLAAALIRAGRVGAAEASLQQAIDLEPNNPEAHAALGAALMQEGKFKEAVVPLQRAVDLKPDYPDARFNLSHVLSGLGQWNAAAEQLREALRARPDWPVALAALAGLEAMAPDSERDPGEAVRLATRAADLTGQHDPYILARLAEAYAAAGRFPDAIRTAEAAAALAGSAPELAAQIQTELGVYRERSHAR